MPQIQVFLLLSLPFLQFSVICKHEGCRFYIFSRTIGNCSMVSVVFCAPTLLPMSFKTVNLYSKHELLVMHQQTFW